MPWMMLILFASVGLHFAPNLAEVLPLETGELRLLMVGGLCGLLLAYVLGTADRWVADRRHRL